MRRSAANLQARTSGITEFVPLPFVHMEAPVYIKASTDKVSHKRARAVFSTWNTGMGVGVRWG